MRLHTSPISGIATSEFGYLATAGYDNKVLLWSGLNREPLAQATHDHLANQCAFSPCGRFLVSASSDHTARLWSLPHMKLEAVLTTHEDDVEMACFHPRLPLIATASRDHHVRVFDFSGKLIKRFEGHSADVNTVVWSTTENELISTSDDGTIRKWDLTTGGPKNRIELGDIETDTLVVSSQGYFYSGNDEGEIYVFNDTARLAQVKAHASGIKRLIIKSDGAALVSLSYDRTVCIWKIGAGGMLELERRTSLPAVVWPRSAAFYRDDAIVFATFGDCFASYNIASDTWDISMVGDTHGKNAVLASGASVFTIGDAGILWDGDAAVNRVGSLCNFLLEFEREIITGGQQGIVFEARSGRKLYQHRSPLNCATWFVHGGKPHFIVGAYTGEGLVFGLSSNGLIEFVRSVQLHPNAVKGVAATNELIFSVCATGAAAFHDTQTFAEVKYIRKGHDKIANGCTALGQTGFASVSRDLKLRIWTGMEAKVFDTPHLNSIKSIAASKDGRFICTAGYRGMIAIYDCERSTWVLAHKTSAAGLSSCCWREETHSFLVSSYDGYVYEEPVPMEVRSSDGLKGR